MTGRPLRNATALAAGATVFFGSLAATAATMLARQVVNPPRSTRGPVRVIKCDLHNPEATAGTITLERTIESETAGSTPCCGTRPGAERTSVRSSPPTCAP